MEIEKLQAPDHVSEECVVVIDVLRAFTTAAFAFGAGAQKIIVTSTAEEAFQIREKIGNCLLMGEIQGELIPGFDFGNSPSQISHADLHGKTLIQRTSAGTQGIVRSSQSKTILASSFAVAQATLERLLLIHPQKITFVITGLHNGDEDRALADYLELKLIDTLKSMDPSPFLQRVLDCPSARYFMEEKPAFPLADLQAAISLDRFPFSMQVKVENGLLTLYPVNASGHLFF